MSLKPLFESESDAEHWKTIKENLALVKSSLWASDDTIMAEKIRAYETAVTIDDAKVRAVVVDLAGSLAYAKKQHLETMQSIACIIRQIESKTN